jgi:hypothetical protein
MPKALSVDLRIGGDRRSGRIEAQAVSPLAMASLLNKSRNEYARCSASSHMRVSYGTTRVHSSLVTSEA